MVIALELLPESLNPRNRETWLKLETSVALNYTRTASYHRADEKIRGKDSQTPMSLGVEKTSFVSPGSCKKAGSCSEVDYHQITGFIRSTFGTCSMQWYQQTTLLYLFGGEWREMCTPLKSEQAINRGCREVSWRIFDTHPSLNFQIFNNLNVCLHLFLYIRSLFKNYQSKNCKIKYESVHYH